VSVEDILNKQIVPPIIPQGEELYGDKSSKAIEETIIPKDKVAQI